MVMTIVGAMRRMCVVRTMVGAMRKMVCGDDDGGCDEDDGGW